MSGDQSTGYVQSKPEDGYQSRSGDQRATASASTERGRITRVGEAYELAHVPTAGTEASVRNAR